MTRYLLDSDGVIDVLKRITDTDALLESLVRQGNVLATCDVVLGEVYTGTDPQDEAVVERFLVTLEFLPTSADAARQAGRWRYAYARRGVALSMTDCLIAATAVEHHAVIITRNTKDVPMPEVSTLGLPRPNRESRQR